MLQLAERIKQSGLGSDMRKFGLTVIVHAREPSVDVPELAVATTLPSRAHQRGMLAHALAQSLLMDGVDMDDASSVAADDYDALMLGRKRKL